MCIEGLVRGWRGGDHVLATVVVDSCCSSRSLCVRTEFFALKMPGPHASKRKAISFDDKRDVIKRKQQGQGNCSIGRDLKLSESTVRTIWKKKDEILAAVKAYGSGNIDDRKRARDPQLIKTERFLQMWIESKERKNESCGKREMKDQAMCFYEVICRKANVRHGTFQASNGWLNNFLKRKHIRKLKYSGEIGSAAVDAAKEFPSVLKEIIDEGAYLPDCIYNMDEAGLQYKMPPKSTYVSKQIKKARGRKIDKVRFTVLFCCNVTGSHKMKPLVVHTAKHPRCYKHLSDMSQAPVYWKTTQNGWMSSALCKTWFIDCFVRDAKWKCQQLGVPFKVLLIMDNCPAHPSYLQDLHPNVKVVFLPPKTTSIVQPLDQEFIGTVKAIYQKHVFRELRQKTDSGDEVVQIIAEANAEQDRDIEADADDLPPLEMDEADRLYIEQYTNPNVINVTQYWRAFTVKSAIDFLMKAWDDINKATIRHAWRPLVPHLVMDERGTGTAQREEDMLDEAAEAARQVPGFEEVTAEEIREVNMAGENMTPDVIMDVAAVEDALEADRKDERAVGDAPVPGELSMQQMCRILAAADSFRETVVENEVSNVRVNEMIDNIKKTVRFYTDLHSKKVNERKQTLITRFARPQAPPPLPAAQDPQPGPSHNEEEEPEDMDFFGFDSVVEEAEKMMRVGGRANVSESESDGGDDPPSATSPQ